MTRARHRWLPFFITCVFILLDQSQPSTAVRATSLIFAKSTTTTAAPGDAPSADAQDPAQGDPTVEGAVSESQNVTGPKLTGFPQIDYIHDPNLPRELNGYNLSEYPFYEAVPPPETMDFKCDGLHDGFYASVEHKCQVYHHCLYGTRFDFLCANYTAFDQKTFICHFVSEVDCKNSPKYFHRNDALYQAASTSPPPPPPTTTTTTTPAPAPAPGSDSDRPRRPGRRRPYHRYDYYDDDYYYPARDDYDYEERGARRRPRPRPQGRPGARKRRPYQDYDDERYERRPRPRDQEEDEDRRPYDRPERPERPDRPERPERPERPRPNGKRNQDRRPYEDEEEEVKRPAPRPKRPRPRDEDNETERPRFRSRDEGRKEALKEDVNLRDEIKPRDERHREEIRPRDEIRSRDDIRPRDEKNRDRDDRRTNDRNREIIRPRDELKDEPRDEIKSRDQSRRDQEKPTESRRFKEDRFRNREDREKSKAAAYEDDRQPSAPAATPAPAQEGQALVKPNGHGIFSQPRMPPKIKRPVPANEKAKYGYVPVTTNTKAPPKVEDEEYYDYEEDDTSKPSSSGKTSLVQARPKPEVIEREKFKPSKPQYPVAARDKPKKRPVDYEDDYYYDPPKTQKYTQKPKKPVDDEYEYDYEDEKEKSPKATKGGNERDISPKKDGRTSVRVIKRPFLPSRGGSPYLPRGLQPVAGKNLTAVTTTTPKPIPTSSSKTIASSETFNDKEQEYDDEEYYDDEDPEYDSKTEKSDKIEESTTVSPTTISTTTEVPKTNPPETTTVTEKAFSIEDITFTESPKFTEQTNLHDAPKHDYTEKPLTNQAVYINKPSTYMERPKPTSYENPASYEYNERPAKLVENPASYEFRERPAKLVEKPASYEYNERPAKIVEKPTSYIERPAMYVERPSMYSERPSMYYERPTMIVEKPKQYTYERPKHIQIDLDKHLQAIPKDYLAAANAKLKMDQQQKAKNLADKVLKVYTDTYERIKGKLSTTLQPGDYIKDYLAAEMAQDIPDDSTYDAPLKPTEPIQTVKTEEIKPEISQPYTATGKPLIPENISIKQNLADSIENDYDVTLNEAAPVAKAANLRNVPSGFLIPADRDYSYTRFRNNLNPVEPQFAASDISNYQLRKRPQINVSLRTPQSFFLQPHPRLSPGYTHDDGVPRARHIVYRQVPVGTYY